MEGEKLPVSVVLELLAVSPVPPTVSMRRSSGADHVRWRPSGASIGFRSAFDSM